MPTYYRCTNKDTAMSDWGHAMFCDSLDKVEHYGKNLFTYDGSQSVNITDLRQLIIDTWETCKSDDDWRDAELNGADMDDYRELTGEEAFEALSPDDIVNSAEAYDCDLGIWFYWYIAEPNNIMAITTNNGAVVWYERLIKKEVKMA